jgi:hypothetical protein
VCQRYSRALTVGTILAFHDSDHSSTLPIHITLTLQGVADGDLLEEGAAPPPLDTDAVLPREDISAKITQGYRLYAL